MITFASNAELERVVEVARRAPDTREFLVSALQRHIDAGRYYVSDEELARAILKAWR